MGECVLMVRTGQGEVPFLLSIEAQDDEAPQDLGEIRID